jgi:hypothetical protein
LDLAARPLFANPAHDDATITVLPSSTIAGADGLIVVLGKNTHFKDGQTVLGVGTSDIAVRRLWVLSPTFLVANVTVHPQATLASFPVTVATGLELVSAADAFKVTAPAPNAFSLKAPATNAVTGLAGVPGGGTVLIRTVNAPADMTGWKVLIGNAPTVFTIGKDGVIAAHVDAALALGAELIQVIGPDGNGPQAIVMQVDAPPPAIWWAFDNNLNAGKGAFVGPTALVSGADSVSIAVTGLDSTQDIWVNVAGVNVTPSLVGPPDKGGISFVTFAMPAVLPYDPKATDQTAPIMIGNGTRLSAPFLLNTHVDPPAPPPATAPAN